MIQDVDNKSISENPDLNDLFLSAKLEEINENCKILKGEFFLDSFNYFPITLNHNTFTKLFKRQNDNSIEHFYNESFYKNFLDNKKNFKIFKNTFVLGTSPADNYFSNLIQFLPRRILIPTLRIINLFWIKKTQPDWYLLNKEWLLNKIK